MIIWCKFEWYARITWFVGAFLNFGMPYAKGTAPNISIEFAIVKNNNVGYTSTYKFWSCGRTFS